MIKGVEDEDEKVDPVKKEIKAQKIKKDVRESNSLIKNTTSLLYRFESCGFDYKQKNQKNLSYRDIEKVLILFRNSYSVFN